MSRLRMRLDIYNRLALALWGVSVLAFVIAAVGLAIYQNLTLEQRARQLLEPYAQLVAVGTDTAVAFEDPQRAQEILDTLQMSPRIVEAAIFLEDGRLLASFSRTPLAQPPSAPLRPDGVHVVGDTVELLQTVQRGARLRLRTGTEQLGEQTRQAVHVFGVCSLVLIAVTLVQLAVLRRTLVRPIARLTEATERVRSRGDYEQRVPAAGDDEVAHLGQNFNAMLAAIQEQQEDLRRVTLFQRAILDNVAYSIMSTTPDGTVTSLNPAAERLLGYTADEVIGKQTPALWHDSDEVARRATELTADLGETVAPGFAAFAARPRRGLPEEREWTFVRKDGGRVPVNLSVTALRDEHGTITGFVGLAYDLTERRRAEQQVHTLNQELERRVAMRTEQLELANKELEAFSYSVSHDLRAPLRAIDGFSNILLEGYGDRLDDEGKRLLGVIRQSTARMGQMIDDILKFSRAGRSELSLSDIDMNRMTREVFEEVNSQAGSTAPRLELEPLPPIRGDRAMIRQVVINLLSNAVKFTRKRDAPWIRVSATTTADEIVYCVRDNGAGFDDRFVDKLFGVFQRLHRAAEFEGTGIGLAIVKRVVVRHGGRVWAEGKVDGGAAIYFALPRSSDADAPVVR